MRQLSGNRRILDFGAGNAQNLKDFQNLSPGPQMGLKRPKIAKNGLKMMKNHQKWAKNGVFLYFGMIFSQRLKWGEKRGLENEVDLGRNIFSFRGGLGCIGSRVSIECSHYLNKEKSQSWQNKKKTI